MQKTICDLCLLEISEAEPRSVLTAQTAMPDGTAQPVQTWDMHPACLAQMVAAVQQTLVPQDPDPIPVAPPPVEPVPPEPEPAPAPEPAPEPEPVPQPEPEPEPEPEPAPVEPAPEPAQNEGTTTTSGQDPTVETEG